MRVKVHYFAVLRERRGVSAETIVVEPGTTIEGLYESIFGDGDLSELRVLFAMNESYVNGHTELEDGADVSFLPPLGGG